MFVVEIFGFLQEELVDFVGDDLHLLYYGYLGDHELRAVFNGRRLLLFSIVVRYGRRKRREEKVAVAIVIIGLELVLKYSAIAALKAPAIKTLILLLLQLLLLQGQTLLVDYYLGFEFHELLLI